MARKIWLLLGALLGGIITPGASAQTSTPIIPDAGSRATPSIPSISPTVLPTDQLPSQIELRPRSALEQLHTKVLQKLPEKLYFTTSVETSFRYETNPFQFPTKRKLLRKFPPPPIFRQLDVFQQDRFYDVLGLVNNDDSIFRVLPNATVGWALTPNVRVGGNYFLIRDQLSHNVRLNTVVQSLGGFIQRDFRIGAKANLLVDMQARELLTLHQLPQFDFLPTISLSYPVTPSFVAYTSTILQLRGRKPFRAPTREIDPFYTVGALWQRRNWIFVASGTFFQAFREPFRQNAVISQDSYSFILDFEISRRILPKIPGLQAFVRAEPIYNLHSDGTPGLSGMDFRFFYGLRVSAIKKPISQVVQQIREDLEEAEREEREKKRPSPPPKPQAFLSPSELTASTPQPIHLFLQEPVASAFPEQDPPAASSSDSRAEAPQVSLCKTQKSDISY